MKSKNTVADTITAFRGILEQQNKITSRQKGIFTTLQQCRTPVLGGHVESCPECGHIQTGFNSCRNRHCPTCNGIKRERWVLARRSEMLPVDYFHVVFTLPDMLNDLCMHYPKQMYGLLFKSTWETMQKFGTSHRHLGA
nr:transposase zinc-binding domain-containing protein [Bacteroidota bacterium]